MRLLFPLCDVATLAAFRGGANSLFSERASHDALHSKDRRAAHVRRECRCRAGGMIDMDADRWRRLRPLLDRVIDLEGEERTAYIRTLRGADEALRGDLERLLAEHERWQSGTPPNALKLVTRALAREYRDEQKQDDIATSEPTDILP